MTMPAGQPDGVLDVLIREHREVEHLLDRLRLADEPSSREAADRMIVHLVRHSVVEEMLIHPCALDFLTEGEEFVAHDVAEHVQLEGMLRELEGLDATDERFLGVVLDVQMTVAQHFADEESLLFPQLRFAVPADELVRLRHALDRAEPLATSGAHPGSPAGDVLMLGVGTGPGMVDRVRRALGARPT
jgi:hypothetical protein